MKTILDNLISTLNRIEVKGKENLDMLLGCIMTLEKMKGMVKTRTEEAEEVNVHDDHNEQGKDV